MAFLDWIKRRKENADLKALGRKYGHEAMGSSGAAIRHYEALTSARAEKSCEPEDGNQKTKPRPTPSWER